MTILEYKEAVKRTLPDLGSKLLNSIHMVLGMVTEYDELIEAVENNDKTNIKEELADIQWYVCNYATIYDLTLPETAIQSAASKKNKNLTDCTYDLGRHIWKLCDFDKKELSYKKGYDTVEKNQLIVSILIGIEMFGQLMDFNMDRARQKVIDKLRLRYPDKFDEDRAINRDIEGERKILEGK